MLAVVFGTGFSPLTVLASESVDEVVVAEEVEKTEEVVVEQVEEILEKESALVEAEAAGEEVIKDIDNLKDKTGIEDPLTEDLGETVDNLEVEAENNNDLENAPVIEDSIEESEEGEKEIIESDNTQEEKASPEPMLKVVEESVEDKGEMEAGSNLEAQAKGNNEVSSDEIEVTPLSNHLDDSLEDISAEYGQETEDSGNDDDPVVGVIIEDVSAEYGNQTTDGNGGGDNGDQTEEVSREYNFNTTADSGPVLDEEVSQEYTLQTLSDVGQEEVSNEYSFTTTSGGGGNDPEEEISREYSFRTLSDIGQPQEEISQEYSFTTDNGGGGGPTLDEEISDEYSFRTLSDIGQEEISSEYSFTTDNNGGGGGGGGGGRRTVVKDIVLPTKCLPLILEYIRLGQNNNPIEVFKLQWFLRTFEGLDVPLSGVYDQTTYEAVKIFQVRHADPILTSWGINEPTGYVFISTSLNINYIYCGLEGVQFDLRNFYKTTGTAFISSPTKGSGSEYLMLPPPVQTDLSDKYMILDTDLPAEIAIKADNLFQVAMIGLTDFLAVLGLDIDTKTVRVGTLWLVLALIIIIILLVLKRLTDNNENKVETTINATLLEEEEARLEAEELDRLVQEYNNTTEVTEDDIRPEAGSGQAQHISETLKDREIELEGKKEDK